MFNPDNQYRCDIIRGKAQKELDNLLSAYVNIIKEITPSTKDDFNINFNNYLSRAIYNNDYTDISEANQKTIRNHITEIAGKLFGLYYRENNFIYMSDSAKKLLEDEDQPAFFKNLCLNFQFPNGTQAIQTVKERIANKIKFKPFHFIIALLNIASQEQIILNKSELGYYVLNSLEVLQGLISPHEVIETIKHDRENKITKKLENTSFNTQHIREQLNLLALANMIDFDGQNVILNLSEMKTISFFLSELSTPLKFDIYKYNLENHDICKLMYSEWEKYFGQLAVENFEILDTSVESLQRKITTPLKMQKGVNYTILGDEGEEYVFELEKARVGKTHSRLVNKVLLLGKQKGLGYDIMSVEAQENYEDPEFARFIEVKATKRATEPSLEDSSWVDSVNLTRKEWIAAKQHRQAYNLYRVYFTATSTIIRKINDPYGKSEQGLLSILPTMYRMDFNSESIDGQY
ncbi:DUF3883 domain-containing protein [Sulfurospirillum sp. 'SP']|nr:DUF3883 domain-containing protein [Sulfurospirillum sp. 'SP']WNY99489.1 DUF3883 domain-containing protein [Sulfurospirillum sp. 'SP']